MLAQSVADTSGAAVGGIVVVGLVGLLVAAFSIVVVWKLYTRMGQSGWSGIVPFLNHYVVFTLNGREWWWVLLLLVPCVNIIVSIVFLRDVARLFGKGIGYTIGLIFLPFIFLTVLAFGSSRYVGPAERVI